MVSRAVIACFVVGSVLFVFTLAHPVIALEGFDPSVEQVSPGDFQRGDYSETDMPVYEIEELSLDDQELLTTAIERDGDATFYLGGEEDLPAIFETTRPSAESPSEYVAYVDYEGDHYRIALGPRQSQLFGVFFWVVRVPAILIGVTASTLVFRSGISAYRNEYRQRPWKAAVAGCIVLLVLLWLFNIHGYIWPVQ